MTHRIQVALPVPRGDCYDYLCSQPVSLGARVRVPFGPRRLVGLVVGHSQESTLPSSRLKAVLEVLDEQPLLAALELDLLRFTATYYQAPLGQTVATALPAMLRQGKATCPQQTRRWTVTATGRDTDPGSLRRAPRQAAALAVLQASSAALPAPAIGSEGCSSAVLQSMADKGLICPVEETGLQRKEVSAPQLNPAQTEAVDRIQASQGFSCFLLDGVTGSGKTEVYLALARQQMAAGRQCLILIPEIGLTPQMVARVEAHTGGRVVALHSGLADGQRHNAWLAARSGEADIVLGTRSAVFVPLARPGLIVVDEEHDASYKQQDGIRYHARDLAVRRAQQADIAIVLGSATPSLESHYNALQQRYTRLHLAQRYGASVAPQITRIDLRGQRCDDGFSNAMVARINAHLAQEQQVLLFINRRGYSPILLCHDCGWTAYCERCDARLISHQRSRSLRCHHCDHQRPLPQNCPDCGSAEIQHLGQGTERIEARAAELWPDTPSIRLDRDQISRKGELEAALQSIQSGEARIIIGTQMLAKGHDFPELSLVCILDADQGLYGQDFRATEQLAQQIVQVAGRAGRREQPGEVVIQTHNPDHPLLLQLDPGNYRAMADQLLEERRQMTWPPFSHLALIRAEANQPEHAQNELLAIAEPLFGLDQLDALGPVPAAMERRGGKYRQQLLLRSHKRSVLQAQLQSIRQQLEARPGARQFRWTLDVDPQNLD